MSNDQELVLAEQLGDLSRTEAIESFNKSERELFDDLYDLSRNASNNLLVYWREVGLRMSKAHKSLKAGRGEYGLRLVERIAAALGVGRSSIDTAIRLAQLWPRKDDYLKLINREANSFRLSWTHLQYLSSVGSDKTRERLINQTFKNGWTSHELLLAIRKEEPRTPGEKPGPPVQLPKSVAACLSNAREMSRKMSQKVTQAWVSSGFDLAKEFDRTPPAYTTPELLADIDATLDAVVKVINDMDTFATSVRAVREKATRRMELAKAATEPDVLEGTAVPVPEADECVHGGKHVPMSDDMGTYCKNCKDPLGPQVESPVATKTKKKR